MLIRGTPTTPTAHLGRTTENHEARFRGSLSVEEEMKWMTSSEMTMLVTDARR